MIKTYSSNTNEELNKAYDLVGNLTWVRTDFEYDNLKTSRALFYEDSLKTDSPTPKKLEVFALLSGISFGKKFRDELNKIQLEISRLLGSSMHYLVKPKNLGVEYCVFKWPEDQWDNTKIPIIIDMIENISIVPFQFVVRGIQINPDGCIVAKGFSEHNSVFRIRSHCRANIEFLPKRQSGWAHVPLGRVLEPLGLEKFRRLKSLTQKYHDIEICSETINSLKLVHEKQWYMEDKTILYDFHL